MFHRLIPTIAIVSFWAIRTAGAEDILLADFEAESYGAWKTSGTAFGSGPARGTLPNQMQVDGYLGKGLVNSYLNGDGSIGTLTSPEFKIERKYIAFLIGGGRSDQLALQLMIDGNVVRSSTGPNDKPGGSESLAPDAWDVAEFVGRKATLRIIDQATGGWGHINVDHIVQTDTKPKGLLKNAERTFDVQSRYLLIPIKNGAAKREVSLLANGQRIVRNDIELADEAPDWWAPMDVSSWKGKSVTLRVDKLREDSSALANIQQSDKLRNEDDLYRESMRGQFHFSPKRGWNNDPNGCVYYNGEYHLFFQHNPYGWGWGNMHWGHAVSRDLVHWEELGDVLLPDDMGPMFSGSAVVDHNNTSGFGMGGKAPLVLIYTAAGNPTVQGIAYSVDGRTFTKYSGNPVLKQITGGNRDPKVIWHEPTKQWVMTLYVEWQGKHTIHFFTSPNLKDWTLASITEGDAPGSNFLFECPDFFELPIDGDPTRKKWVLLAANSDYAIGSFDGKKFSADATRLKGHRGRGFYAAQSFSDAPDGRRIFIGWWQTETKGMPFNQSMSLPLELALTQTNDGPRITFSPAKELQSLRDRSYQVESRSLRPGEKNPLDDIQAELLELRMEFEPGEAQQVVLNIRDVMVEYDAAKQELSVAGHHAAAPLRDGRQRLVIYCDRTGVEVFASDGLCYVPMPYNTKPENKRIFLESRGGAAMIHSLEVHQLKSAWR
ncbi:MAG: glycoside hydrolase family 32 protein [Planctomycetes bacterium]|nr:glycoside hydrolase family 32 protein [Planctomycetota bacterium]